MTFSRFVFVFAFLMLLVGAGIGRWLIGPSLGRPAQSGSVLVADAPTTTATAASRPTRTPTRAIHRAAAPRPTSTATPAPTSTALPTPTPASGAVTMTRYWIGALQARAGQTMSVGYVIDNGTGRTVRLLLGASLKPSRSPSWAIGTLNDPAHDVVAIVPPGRSTHVRFFTIPPGIRPGSYDVAWGLRDALTAQRDALVVAPGVLRVF